MIPVKSPKEIAIMVEGGEKLKLVLGKVMTLVKPGISTLELDKIAEKEMIALGGKSSFKMVPGYHWATCITLNNEVVHGIPKKNKIIKDGDSVGIDAGMYYKGFHTDTSWSIKVKSPLQGKQKSLTGQAKVKTDGDNFLEAGEKALTKAIEQVKPGNYVGDISLAIQKEIEGAGYSPVRVLTGHGVGRELHEEPMIPCFFQKGADRRKTPLLKEGMVLAIEVIYNLGSPEVVLTNDGWTIVTEDGKIAGLFEKTVAVIADGHLILT